MRPYLECGSLVTVVDHLCVELLFLHLLLQLGDTSLQPPLLVSQHRTGNNKEETRKRRGYGLCMKTNL